MRLRQLNQIRRHLWIVGVSLIFTFVAPRMVNAADLQSLVKQYDVSLSSALESDGAREAAELILKMGNQLDDDRIRARGLLRIAFLEVGKPNGKFHAPLRRGIQLAGKGNTIARAEALMYGGYVRARGLEEFREALDDLNQAVQIARKTNNDRVLVFSLLIRAEIQFFLGQDQQASQSLYRATAFADKRLSPNMQQRARRRLLLHLRSIGGFEAAVPYARTQIEVANKLGKISHVAEEILWRTGNLPQHDHTLRRRLGLTTLTSDRLPTFDRMQDIEQLQLLGWIIHRHRPKESQVYSRIAERYYRTLGSDDRVAWCQLVGLMAKSRTIPKSDRAEILADFHELREHAPSLTRAINFQHANVAVAEFLSDLGDHKTANDFRDRANERLRNIANQTADVAQTNAENFVIAELERRARNRELRVKQAEMDQQAALIVQQQRSYTMIRNAFLVFLAASAVGFLLVKHYLLVQHRKRLQEEVYRKTEHLALAKQDAETARDLATRAALAKSDFFAQLNHEIRNPLQAILGFIESLQQQTDDIDQPRILESLNCSSEHLLQLVNNALDMSMLENNKAHLIEAPFRFTDLVQAIRPILVELAEKKGLRLRCNLSPSIPHRLLGDEVKIRQIMMNLAMNAIKFTSHGEVNLSIGVSSRSDGKCRVMAMVSDSGCGISEQELLHIFDPFSQSRAAKDSRVGTGLGLYICHSYTKLMGGTLHAESEIGKGTVFRLQLPLAEVAPALDPDTKVDSIAQIDTGTQILVVDDNIAIRESLNVLLSTVGLTPRLASGFDEASELLCEWTPDLIVLDIHMPDKSGYDLAQYIRELADFKQPIIIGLTGDVGETVRRQAMQKGFDDLLAKPVSLRGIQHALERWLVPGQKPNNHAIAEVPAADN